MVSTHIIKLKQYDDILKSLKTNDVDHSVVESIESS